MWQVDGVISECVLLIWKKAMATTPMQTDGNCQRLPWVRLRGLEKLSSGSIMSVFEQLANVHNNNFLLMDDSVPLQRPPDKISKICHLVWLHTINLPL